MSIYLKRIMVFICAFALFSMILFPLVDSLTKTNVAKASPGVSFAGSTFKISKTSVKPNKVIKAKAKIKAWGEKAPGTLVEFDVWYVGPYALSDNHLASVQMYTDSKGKAQWNFTLADIDPYYVEAGDTYEIDCWAWDGETLQVIGYYNIVAKKSE